MSADLLKELGLDHSVMAANEGNLPEEKFHKILTTLKDESLSDEIGSNVASSFATWIQISGTGAGNGEALLNSHAGKVLEVVEYLGGLPDDGTADDYNGKQKWAHSIINGLSTFGMMKQDFMKSIAPTAYQILGRLLAKGFVVKDTGVYVKEQASTERCELFKCLLRCAPHSGSVSIPNAVTVIADIICNEKSPKSLKDYAKQAMSSMANINKEAMAHSGMSLMKIISAGGNDDMIFSFLSMPELYTNDPACIHDHLDKVLSMNWMHVCSIVNSVASRNAAVLVPHTALILGKLAEAPAMGAVTIGILKEIAKADPAAIYPFIDKIIQDGKGVTGAAYSIAGCISNAALTTTPPGAADILLPKLMDVLKSTEAAYAPSVLAEVSNLKDLLSDRALLAPYMDFIVSMKPSNSAIVQIIEDFFAGRSLQSLEIRVDAIEVKITELNNKVAESCASFEDVMAYVDANIADMKDFVGDVVKKLPAPKRLEVVGTLRKTLILHFECVHTGYEFPIVSKEWSKWLKMGFALAKAGKAVFDIGTGNPLGLLSTGVECVKGIYDAYKTNDDDEFNTYITQPFLTSTEQDQLLEKLRDQGFFEKLAYDNQAPGWYLLNPEADGTPPAGEAGSVSKVWKKEGYGVGEAIASGAAALAGELELSDISAAGLEIGGAVVGAAADAVQERLEKNGSATTSESAGGSPAAGKSKSTGGPTPGGRAAAMRGQMAAAGTLDTGAMDSKLQSANQMVDLQNKVSELESKQAKMERKIQEMEAAIERNAANGGGGCCTIS